MKALLMLYCGRPKNPCLFFLNKSISCTIVLPWLAETRGSDNSFRDNQSFVTFV